MTDRLARTASLAAPLIAVFFLQAPGTALAAAKKFVADYTVSLYGLTLAHTSFTSTLDGNDISIDGTIATAGVARIIDDTKGTTTVRGHLSGDGVTPDSFAIAYKSGKKNKRTEIDFTDGAVSRTMNEPPLKKRKKWVPLSADDLKAVTDPLSGIMVRADKPADVCNKTLRYYDGELRADIAFSYAGKKPLSIPGYSGDATVCMARFTPVGGYRPGNSTIEYLKNKGKMTIAFAPMGSTGMFVPVSASVGTKIGTVSVSADRLEAKQ
ncbi:MAG: DUF3108 domain-containing protein [Rhizobiales bacterium]|jgi:hypothetical protein|nr:DUF3108 domain-containing protein [Hyphomicrobiales bacterium]